MFEVGAVLKHQQAHRAVQPATRRLTSIAMLLPAWVTVSLPLRTTVEKLSPLAWGTHKDSRQVSGQCAYVCRRHMLAWCFFKKSRAKQISSSMKRDGTGTDLPQLHTVSCEHHCHIAQCGWARWGLLRSHYSSRDGPSDWTRETAWMALQRVAIGSGHKTSYTSPSLHLSSCCCKSFDRRQQLQPQTRNQRPPLCQLCALSIFDTSSAITRSARGAAAGTLSGWNLICRGWHGRTVSEVRAFPACTRAHKHQHQHHPSTVLSPLGTTTQHPQKPGHNQPPPPVPLRPAVPSGAPWRCSRTRCGGGGYDRPPPAA